MENFACLVAGFMAGVIICVAAALMSAADDTSRDLGEKNETEYL